MSFFNRPEKGKGLMKRYKKLQAKHDKDQSALSEASTIYQQSKYDLVVFLERHGKVVELLKD